MLNQIYNKRLSNRVTQTVSIFSLSQYGQPSPRDNNNETVCEVTTFNGLNKKNTKYLLIVSSFLTSSLIYY